jgi:DNA-binding transcriptional regulator YbjK
MTAETGETGPAGRIPEAIMNAALDLFYRQGIDGSSVRDIAARADVSLSSVYAYFENKDALIRRVIWAALPGASHARRAAHADWGCGPRLVDKLVRVATFNAERAP